ncbi:AI-2E family transporter [Halopenitus sp. POP-27]|uniref:AI-2E family transporter n=1 Tax=Halopenitus sp. POP-27 TaxID=2994425 RepID=UPI002468D700|nr:AI-2E family transporter [Halopenitus sp. POP-27]
MVKRRYVLGGLLVFAALVAAVLLWEVAGTVFFAITVAYVLSPIRRSLRNRGASRRIASVAATVVGFLGTLVLLAPLGIVLFLRLDAVIAYLNEAPETIPIIVGDWSTTIVTADVIDSAIGQLLSAATEIAAAMPVLLIKFALFVFVVYSVLYYEQRTRKAIIAVVPPAYRDLADALHRRAQRTLYGIYVVQAATGIGTFLIAIPVFFVFGYPSPVMLAAVAGILQFVPVVGPILLIAALAATHVIAGDLVLAVAILVIGGGVIGWIPDLAIRTRLAAETAELAASLYFIGFVGGVLTTGPIGVIAGPLAVATVSEVATQLSEEFNRLPVSERR